MILQCPSCLQGFDADSLPAHSWPDGVPCRRTVGVEVGPSPQPRAVPVHLSVPSESPMPARPAVYPDDAACRGMDPTLFFPEQGEDARQAKAVCATCPVTEECEQDRQIFGIKHGVWGGMAEADRRKTRRMSIARRCPRCATIHRVEPHGPRYCEPCRDEARRESQANYDNRQKV